MHTRSTTNIFMIIFYTNPVSIHIGLPSTGGSLSTGPAKQPQAAAAAGVSDADADLEERLNNLRRQWGCRTKRLPCIKKNERLIFCMEKWNDHHMLIVTWDSDLYTVIQARIYTFMYIWVEKHHVGQLFTKEGIIIFVVKVDDEVQTFIGSVT